MNVDSKRTHVVKVLLCTRYYFVIGSCYVKMNVVQKTHHRVVLRTYFIHIYLSNACVMRDHSISLGAAFLPHRQVKRLLRSRIN